MCCRMTILLPMNSCFTFLRDYRVRGISVTMNILNMPLFAGAEGLVVLGGAETNSEDSRRQCFGFISMLQHIVKQGLSGTMILSLPASTRGAMLSGVSKSFALEYPDVLQRRIFSNQPTNVQRALSCWLVSSFTFCFFFTFFH